MSSNLTDALKKALNTAAGTGGDFLPTPLAKEFIGIVNDLNFLRQAFKTVQMETKTRDYPKILGGTKVYYQPVEGAEGVTTGFNTGTIRLEAKKFMARMNATEEVLEDAQSDMQTIIKDHFATTLAAAEEEAMIVGNTAHTPVTVTEASASSSTWFNKDHRLIFNGLLTLAGDISGSLENDTRAANRVDAAGGDMSTAIARQAMFNLGKYGRVMNDLILILNPWSANQLMDDAKLVTLEKYGPKATIFTGEFGKLYGKVSVINSAYCTDGYGVMTHRGNPMIGDRRQVRIKQADWIQDDTKMYVITERMDFTVQYKSALCQIYSLDTPSTMS